MSSTYGLIGNGIFNSTKLYKRYNTEHWQNKSKGSNLLNNGFQIIWGFKFFKDT